VKRRTIHDTVASGYAELFQREFEDGYARLLFEFPESLPGSSDQVLASPNVIRIQVVQPHFPFDLDWFETGVVNELGEDRVATDMAFWRRVEDFRVDQPKHVPQVKVAFNDRFDIPLTDVTDVTFIALCHGFDSWMH
jgi:hypothetical protein